MRLWMKSAMRKLGVLGSATMTAAPLPVGAGVPLETERAVRAVRAADLTP